MNFTKIVNLAHENKSLINNFRNGDYYPRIISLSYNRGRGREIGFVEVLVSPYNHKNVQKVIPLISKYLLFYGLTHIRDYYIVII